MSNLEHIALYILLFSLFFFWGRYCYNIKYNLNFWLIALIPIIAYALIVGSRYGWGPDYFSYKYKFEHAYTYNEEQLGFRWLNQTLSRIGLNYVGAYISYSLIFITSAFVFIRSFGKESKFMYAFLIPASLILINHAIRQGVALSFIFLALYFFNNGKLVFFVLSIIVGASIHTAMLSTVALLGIFYFTRKWRFDWRISILVYIFFTFFYDVSETGIIANYLSGFSLGNNFQSYIENSDQWFGKEAANEIYKQSTGALIFSAIFHVIIIYLGNISLKYRFNERLVWIYNTVVFGFIFYRAVFYFEILRRIAEPLVMFYFVILGYILWVFLNRDIKNDIMLNKISQSKFRSDMNIFRGGIFIVLIYLILFWGRFVFFAQDSLFFWNK